MNKQSLLNHVSPQAFKANGYNVNNVAPEITADWWQWVLSEPQATNPQYDKNGDFAASGDQGKYFFVAGTFGGDAERSFTVDANQKLVIPLLNAFAVKTEPDETAEYLRDYVTSSMDRVTDLDLKVDGKEFSDDELFQLRTYADEFSFVFPDSNNLYSLPAGEYEPAFSDGYWAMLKLSPGKHDIEFGGEGTNPDGTPFAVHVTTHITVLPPGQDSSSSTDLWAV